METHRRHTACDDVDLHDVFQIQIQQVLVGGKAVIDGVRVQVVSVSMRDKV